MCVFCCWLFVSSKEKEKEEGHETGDVEKDLLAGQTGFLFLLATRGTAPTRVITAHRCGGLDVFFCCSVLLFCDDRKRRKKKVGDQRGRKEMGKFSVLLFPSALHATSNSKQNTKTKHNNNNNSRKKQREESRRKGAAKAQGKREKEPLSRGKCSVGAVGQRGEEKTRDVGLQHPCDCALQARQ